VFLRSALHLLHTLRLILFGFLHQSSNVHDDPCVDSIQTRMLMMNAVLSQHVDSSFPNPILPVPSSNTGWPTFYGFFITLSRRHCSTLRSELLRVVHRPELSYLRPSARRLLLMYQ